MILVLIYINKIQKKNSHILSYDYTCASVFVRYLSIHHTQYTNMASEIFKRTHFLPLLLCVVVVFSLFHAHVKPPSFV